jgi:hypothetical protein
MTTTIDPRTALLELHRVLLQHQRVLVERVGGRMSASELLQAATDDLRFSWLQTLSGPITAFDAARADEDPAAAEAALDAVRALIAPPDDATPFGRVYLRALQDDPAVVMAHRDAVAAIAR